MVELFDGELLNMLRQLQSTVVVSWTSGAGAVTGDGLAVHPLDHRAKKWCLLGAVSKIAWKVPQPERRDVRYEALLRALCYVEPAIQIRTPAIYNDQEGQEAVLQVVTRALEVEQARMDRL